MFDPKTEEVRMSFETFIERAIEDITAIMTVKGYDVEPDIFQMNGKTRVCFKVGELSPSVTLERLYEMYSGVSYMEFLEKTVDMLIEAIDEPPFILDDFTNYEWAKQWLKIGLMESEKVEENKVSETIENTDLAIVYYLDINNQLVCINKDILRIWGVTPTQIRADALNNSQRYDIIDFGILGEMMFNLPSGEISGNFYLASNGFFGASVIVHPEFFHDAAEKLGGSFYMLPMSVHEWMLISDNERLEFTVDYMKSMVKEANRVIQNDILSDTVYHYDSEDEVFETADGYLERTQS
jgi:hypothetical protein